MTPLSGTPKAVLCLLLLVTQKTSADYPQYYIERDCPAGNLTLPLSGSGSGSSVRLGVSPIHPTYTLAMECRIEVHAPHPGYRVVAAIRELGFRANLDGTCMDYLKIQEPKCEGLYRVDEERRFFSEGSIFNMHYHVSGQGLDNLTPTNYVGCTLILTAVAEEGCLGGENRFQCANGFCIWSGLRCDAHNNCGDLSDEQECGPAASGGSTVLIILGILILSLLVIMCAATLLCTKNERVRRFSTRLRSQTISYLRRFSK